MANNVKINEMGNEVVDGFECKPVDFDPNRPIMHYQSLLFICDDERCHKAHKEDKSIKLRKILKDLELNKGANRIKITRTFCNGACRFRAVAQLTTNTQAGAEVKNNALWLKATHKYSDDEWINIFKLLSNNKILSKELPKESFIPMKVYD